MKNQIYELFRKGKIKIEEYNNIKEKLKKIDENVEKIKELMNKRIKEVKWYQLKLEEFEQNIIQCQKKLEMIEQDIKKYKQDKKDINTKDGKIDNNIPDEQIPPIPDFWDIF